MKVELSGHLCPNCDTRFEDESFMTVREVARYIRVRPETVKRRIRMGRMPGRLWPTKQGYQWIVPTREYHEWFAANGIRPQDLEVTNNAVAAKIRKAMTWYKRRGRRAADARWQSQTPDPRPTNRVQR